MLGPWGEVRCRVSRIEMHDRQALVAKETRPVYTAPKAKRQTQSAVSSVVDQCIMFTATDMMLRLHERKVWRKVWL